MFKHNVGMIDRVIRVVIGLALIAGFWIWPDTAWRWAFWVGLIPLVSGLVGYCPVYHLLGWSTSDEKHGGNTRTA
ncbi:Protein of unknown function [Meinhardsimonia xiamenensis]|jgi:hypothetical protein|uniref:Inner membrane protein YgaP-like transmembrane domain-containing protein n=1 Tax=Meinhardsimonia xiamenensis TaxID=990712 RepID=A0A1G9D203_9RHOB|nr:DUF2892 domain-containing protein [Meinhardsimonia xiamenensis]PRX38162.1 Protein of unknown function (DUF2892) [Meinhardsimonia xiamenensis]SDK57833.1 Protein of unknown function [Meinhardsimonia xiamenensis]